MSIDRITRVNNLLRREISEAIYHVIGPDEIDLSAITITDVSTHRNLRKATVMISILNHQQERGHIIAAFKRHRADFQKWISTHVVLKYTPRLSFELDPSLEKGAHILDIIADLDIPPDQEEMPEDTE